MTHEEFDKLMEKRFEKSREVLLTKATEYAIDTERLQNFIDGAVYTMSSPAWYALALTTKHLMSLRDYIVLRESDIDQKIIDEKIGDVINYMLLLEAILTEKLK